jgi:hypothetical protein
MASKKVLLLCGDYMEDYEVSIQSLLVYFAPVKLGCIWIPKKISFGSAYPDSYRKIRF